jgi:hypothetical protein
MLQIKEYPMFLVGLYQNRRGKKFVLKMWEGTYKNSGYYDLLHEIAVTKTLRTIHRRIKKQLPQELRNFSVLKYTNHIITKKRIIMITEYSQPGKINKRLNSQQKAELLLSTKKYLHIIGSHATQEEIMTITSKKGVTYILQFPIIWVMALMRHPNFVGDLILGLMTFIKGIPALLGISSRALVHGDLDTSNIFYNEKGVSITDLEQTIFSFSCLETIATISSKKNSQSIIELILEDFFQDKINKSLFAALSVFTAIYSLTGINSHEGNERYIFVLKAANKLLLPSNMLFSTKRRVYESK